MMKIMTRDSDGAVHCFFGAPKSALEAALQRQLSDAEYEILIRKTVPTGHTVELEWHGGEFPEGGVDFQQAWEASNGEVIVNMDKAREEWRGKIRKYRAGRFKELDLEEFSADRRQDAEATGRIDAVKQRLRDAPADPRIDAAKTPDELKKIWIDELGAE